MDVLVSASLVSAFIAGIAALAAPCCITVLLPTYFASVVKQKRTVFLMTFVYFLGLLAVFIPIGLGTAAVSMLFRQYHDALFFGGASFLVLLGISLLLGKQFSLPMIAHPEFKKYDMVSIFILGIFSAIATTCCAPVLAGVLTLSALPGSYLWGALYTITYVLGMVIPLFVLSAVLDKTRITQKLLVLRTPMTFKLFRLTITSTLSNVVSGSMYFFIGILILYLTITNQLTMQNTYQLSVTIYIARLTQFIGTYTGIIPEPVWAGIFVLIIGAIIIEALKQWMDRKKFMKGGEHHEIH